MSILDYEGSKKLSLVAHCHDGNAFLSLLMATMREAGSVELAKLHVAFPEVFEELKARVNAPGGALNAEEIAYVVRRAREIIPEE